MKRVLLLLMIGIFLAKCNSKPVEKPENLIEKPVMIDILYDLHLLNAIRSNGNNYETNFSLTPEKYIYKKYKIDSAQFSSSNRYYASDLQEYEEMFELIMERLKKNKPTIDSISTEKPVEKIKSKKRSNEDSLKEKKSLNEVVLKDSILN